MLVKTSYVQLNYIPILILIIHTSQHAIIQHLDYIQPIILRNIVKVLIELT